jgi:hypothetical protein
LIVFLEGRRGECQSTPQTELFKVGEFKEYKVVTPKKGFIGSPPSPSAAPDIRRPAQVEDFDNRFLRVTLIGTRAIEEGRRIVMRLDEIDAMGTTKVPGLYYAYMDVQPEGTLVICRRTDDGGNSDEADVIRYGLPFPFGCARPPTLGFKNGKKDGYVDSVGRGVEFARKDGNAQSGVITVEATHFERSADWAGKAPASPAWYRGDIEDVKNDGRTKVHFREKQQWGKATGWLWDEMERVDKDGNLLMRCRKK